MYKASKKKIYIILFALFSAVIITIGRYFIAFDDNIRFYAFLEYVNQYFHKDSSQVESDELYINVAYDKQLIEVYDDFGMPKGVVDVTDRAKLVQLLSILKETNQHKFIFLDVRFEKGYASPSDSALFDLIATTPRLVASTHKGMELEDSTILTKTAIGDYTAKIDENTFTRFELIQDGMRSVPLMLYEEVTQRPIETHGALYLFDGKPGDPSPFVRFGSSFDTKTDNEGNYKYYELGVDILESMIPEDIGTLVKDKYVVIGNLIDDVHLTYSGSQPGSYIIMRSFKTLLNGENLENIWCVITMALIYFILVVLMLTTRTLCDFIPIVRKLKSKGVKFAISMFLYSVILSACTMVMYLAWGMIYNIFIPTIYFSITSTIVENWSSIKTAPVVSKLFNKGNRS